LKQKILPSIIDYFSGVPALGLPILIYAYFANDQLLYLFIAMTCLAFTGSFYRGKVNIQNPKFSFLLFNLGFLFMTLDEFIK
jgi:hypothetical protein